MPKFGPPSCVLLIDAGSQLSTMGVMETDSGYKNRQISPEEQRIYGYFLKLVETAQPDESIERFRQLFMDGGCQDTNVAQALNSIVMSRSAEQEFNFLLNRCCHILINRWQLSTRSNAAIPELVCQFENIPSQYGVSGGRSRSTQRLRSLVKSFTQSDQYQTLHRLLQVMEHQATEAIESERPLGSLIRRYPYLYEHCLLNDASTNEQQSTIQRLQSQHQRRFELDLSQYVLYQVRCARAARKGPEKLAQLRKRMQTVNNPTLMTNPELAHAVKHFTGKVESGQTYRDLAHGFHAHSTYGPNFGQFKQDLYQYLKPSVDPSYGKRRFNQQLCNHLKGTLTELDGKPMTDFLLVRTCGSLLNFLVVESSNRLDHLTFIDLIGNMGATSTTGLLLKVVLLCSKVKPHLEKRLAILFNHYEASTSAAVSWLVQVLENLNIAFSTNFGGANLTLAL